MKIILMALQITLLCFSTLAGAAQVNHLSVTSPDGHIQVLLNQNSQGDLTYSVVYDKQPVLEPSLLGFAFKHQPTLNHFDILSSHLGHYDQAYRLPWGQNKRLEDNHNELFVALKDKKSQRRLNLRFRVFNDGVGFRYEFPAQKAMQAFVIMDEQTRFNLAGNFDSWWIPADYDSYEKLYHHTPVSKINQVQTPLTMKTADGLYVSVHEAALTDYASMTLKKVAKGQLEAELVPWADGSKVKGHTPFNTPWRTIQLGKSPAELANSHLILNLNEPSKIADTRWIKPMKYVGIWWGVHIGVYTWQQGPRHGATTARAKQYIDFAAANHIGGVLFEGWNKGWDHWGQRDAYMVPAADFDLKAVADYARQKGVHIVGHNETGGNVLAYEKNVDDVFSLYNKLGINTVKTGHVAPKGFANHEHHQGQWGVNYYRRIVKLAARHHIMLDVHEPIKDTGIRRTWPNMMTREGARGGEYNAWSEGNSPSYTMTLPFTRFLAGPMDYTPGIFDIDYSRFKGHRFDWNGKPQTGSYRVHSTLARQLADMVIMYSPLQMAADMIENYQGHPAFQFIRDLDVDYDQSQVLNGQIGQYITVARRAGKKWYVATATNEQPRKVTVDLSFLTAGVNYQADIYRDSQDANYKTNPEAYVIEHKLLNQTSQLTLTLAGGGGAAIYLHPAN